VWIVIVMVNFSFSFVACVDDTSGGILEAWLLVHSGLLLHCGCFHSRCACYLANPSPSPRTSVDVVVVFVVE
jgi:hypothetical protein